MACSQNSRETSMAGTEWVKGKSWKRKHRGDRKGVWGVGVRWAGPRPAGSGSPFRRASTAPPSTGGALSLEAPGQRAAFQSTP